VSGSGRWRGRRGGAGGLHGRELGETVGGGFADRLVRAHGGEPFAHDQRFRDH